VLSLPFVFIPLTIGTVSLKSSSGSNVTIIRNLSTCYNALGVLAERYEIVDYYLQLNEMCTALTHERVLQEKLPYKTDLAGLRRSMSMMQSSEPSVAPLPPTEIYSSVLRAIERCFVRGASWSPGLVHGLNGLDASKRNRMGY
jgi:hypothetical protein